MQQNMVCSKILNIKNYKRQTSTYCITVVILNKVFLNYLITYIYTAEYLYKMILKMKYIKYQNNANYKYYRAHDNNKKFI